MAKNKKAIGAMFTSIGPPIDHSQSGPKPDQVGDFLFRLLNEKELKQLEREKRLARRKKSKPNPEGDRIRREFHEMLEEELKDL